MDKSLKPEQLIEDNHLAAVEAPVRAKILAKLPKGERFRITDSLVESAMTLGLTEPLEIREWLGIKSVGLKSITASYERVLNKWLAETSDVFEYAKSQRAMQIKKAWQEVKLCEMMFEDAQTTNDRVNIKKLQLTWLQYISKLSLVDKMVEASSPDMQIVVNGGLTVEGEKDGD